MNQSPNFFAIRQERGNPLQLSGKLIAYATVADSDADSSPLADLIQGGILAVSGEYQHEKSFKDFLRNEFKGDLNKGLEEIADQLKRIDSDNAHDSDNDGDDIKKKFENFANMEIIPVPARIIFFNSKEELLRSPCDIFYLGHFGSLQNAHLCTTSFPIIYQGIYREQLLRFAEEDVISILGEIESDMHTHAPTAETWALADSSLKKFSGDLKSFLLNETLPHLIYHLNDDQEYNALVSSFRGFMKSYSVKEDVDTIISYLEELKNSGTAATSTRKLELMCEKIAAVHNEEFEQVRKIQAALKALESPH